MMPPDFLDMGESLKAVFVALMLSLCHSVHGIDTYESTENQSMSKFQRIEKLDSYLTNLSQDIKELKAQMATRKEIELLKKRIHLLEQRLESKK